MSRMIQLNDVKLPRPPNRRRLRIVDHSLQQSMLVALVLMETVIVSLAIWALYRALAAIVDDNLYRIHFQGGVDMLSLLVREGAPILGAMLAINCAALLAADRIWAHYVGGIIGTLAQMMSAAARLDFSGAYDSAFHHKVLNQARVWHGMQAARLEQLRDLIRGLPDALPAPGPQRAALAAALAHIAHD